jgi:aspartate aminotransferase-like enzyme
MRCGCCASAVAEVFGATTDRAERALVDCVSGVGAMEIFGDIAKLLGVQTR